MYQLNSDVRVFRELNACLNEGVRAGSGPNYLTNSCSKHMFINQLRTGTRRTQPVFNLLFNIGTE